jgi:hypothetical protein
VTSMASTRNNIEHGQPDAAPVPHVVQPRRLFPCLTRGWRDTASGFCVLTM